MLRLHSGMEILERETVRVKDRDVVEKKLQELITGGPSKLQVVSDFDYTLSKPHKDGVECATMDGILTRTSVLPEEFRRQSKFLLSFYQRVLSDPNLTRPEKIAHMIEWRFKVIISILSSGLSESDVPEIAKASNVYLRDGCEILVEYLHKHNVPLLIFFAGFGDILKEVLKQQNALLPNTKVIANYLDFDEQGKLRSFLPFDKNLTAVGDNGYFDSLQSRNNVIILGNSIDDSDGLNGAENVNVILKIGFLNSRIEDLLSKYLDAYDIVITDDQTMDVVNGLLQNILC